jgi:hypothetical protein
MPFEPIHKDPLVEFIKLQNAGKVVIARRSAGISQPFANRRFRPRGFDLDEFGHLEIHGQVPNVIPGQALFVSVPMTPENGFREDLESRVGHHKPTLNDA